jgi:hypothetical protein
MEIFMECFTVCAAGQLPAASTSAKKMVLNIKPRVFEIPAELITI